MYRNFLLRVIVMIILFTIILINSFLFSPVRRVASIVLNQILNYIAKCVHKTQQRDEIGRLHLTQLLLCVHYSQELFLVKIANANKINKLSKMCTATLYIYIYAYTLLHDDAKNDHRHEYKKFMLHAHTSSNYKKFIDV